MDNNMTTIKLADEGLYDKCTIFNNCVPNRGHEHVAIDKCMQGA